MAGWDDFDAVPVPEADQADIVDKLFVTVFAEGPGRQLLAYWKKQYLDQPVCQPGAGADQGYFREGQNSIVREAINRVKRGTTPQ